MPKIDVAKKKFLSELKNITNLDDLIPLLEYAKGELDDVDNSHIRIELNDTNRPDLWSSVGLLRLLKQVQGAPKKTYDFFSTKDKQIDTKYSVVVDKALHHVRPYIASFVAKGLKIDQEVLDQLIQMQEKLGENYGQKRRGLAIGLYRLGGISFPVQYRAVDPKKTSFFPLGGEKTMNLVEILQEHPTGKKYAGLLEGLEQFPYLCDSQGETLSFPPVINSDSVGKVEIGDEELFVECTGADQEIVLLGASILATSFSDFGFTISPVSIEYPYDTPQGRKTVTPFYFQEHIDVSLAYLKKMTGKQISTEEVLEALEMFDIACTPSKDKDILRVHPPIYRNDFLHQADVVEEVIIAKGLSFFAPEIPQDFTVGRLLPGEMYARRLRDIFVGLGYQEMVFNYLGSREDFIEMCYPEEEWADIESRMLEIVNPISANYALVRMNPLGSFLRVEATSSRAVYPHMQFEIGKRAFRDDSHPEKTRTETIVGGLVCDGDADFNTIHRHMAAVLYYFSISYRLESSNDSRFLPGRAADVFVEGQHIGVYGELHPMILERWKIGQPCAYTEFTIDSLYEK